MAHDLSMKFSVDSREVSKAVDELIRMGKVSNNTSTAFAQGFRQVVQWQKKFASEQGKVNAKLEEAHRKQQLANKSAKDSASVFQQEAANLERLRQKYDQGHVAMEIYSKELNDLAMARRLDVITAKEQKAAIERLNVATKQGTVVSAEYGGAAGQMGRRMSRSGVMVQQAGYQVGDFIVQVQSGQNPMVAFGQQATQMAGTLTMLGGKFILWGTILGVVIPLATALGAALMRTRKGAKDAADDVETFEEKLKSAREQIKGTEEDLRLLRSAFSEAFQLTLSDQVEEEVAALKVLQDELIDLQNAPQKRNIAGNPRILAKKKEIEAQEEVVRLAREELNASGQVLKDTETLTKVREILARAAEVTAERAERARQAQQDYNDLVTETARSQTHQLTALQNIYALGEDSVKVAKLRAEEEARGLKLNVEDTAQYVARALLLRDEIASIERKTEGQKAFDASVKAAAASYDRLVNQSSSLDVEIAKVDAQIKALKNNTDVATAAYIAGERAKITSTYETTRALAVQNNNMILLAQNAIAYSEALGKLDTLEGLKFDFAELSDDGSSGGGGGSKTNPAEEFAKYLEGLKQQAEIEGKLVGLFGEKRDVEKAILEAQYKYGPKIMDRRDGELRATLMQIDAEKERQRVLEEAQAEQQSIADTLKSSMSDAFMSMVEGTKSFKDAMKDMARAVIKQLYDVLVVQRMVGSFNAKDPSSSTGIAGLLGKALFSFDGGGYTGSGPRSGGMDGRGGYLAMLHPRETVVDHTKAGSAGGGESVTVQQTFNFSANGDDSVKKIIAQAAPSIANMAKQSVMDARRRGGAMKNTFG